MGDGDPQARLAAIEQELDATIALLEAEQERLTRRLVPPDDIWDDDPIDEGRPPTGLDGRGADTADDSWTWRDAQVVVHDLDGEPFGEPWDDPVYDGGEAEAVASRMARWGHSSFGGAAMLGFGRAMEKVLREPEPTEIVSEVDDDADQPLRPVDLHLVPGHPERSVAYVRRWMLRRGSRRDAASTDHLDGPAADGGTEGSDKGGAR